MKQFVFYCLVLTSILLSACAPAVTPATEPPATEPTAELITTSSFQLTSTAFEPGGAIPPKYACGSEGVSPALNWNEPPTGTQSFALIMDDPDASSVPFVHWVIYNIPASARSLPEAVPTDEALPDGSLNGRTSINSIGYMGPCPPSGVHHYSFKLYALDSALNFSAPALKDDLLKAMEGHILAQSELIGTFQK